MPYTFTKVDCLCEPPIKRAAYSDRTSWLMAVMSKLAYVPFEGAPPLDEMAKNLARETNERNIINALKALLASENQDRFMNELKSDLGDLGFELVETYNVSIPMVVDTQAFLAKLTLKGREPMLVLAFRGTEVRKIADIKSDLTANPVVIGPEGAGHKVHSGFYEAFRAVQDKIESSLARRGIKGLPLYITGHSLGGGLAIVATYCISNDSLGACYTFGGPRVGNLVFGMSIKTPVYRVVNAADIVPRLPPTYLIEGLTLLLRWLPMIPYNMKIADFLEKFRSYRHYADLRYLTSADPVSSGNEGEPARFPGLQLLSNPSQLSRWFWLYRRLLATMGRAAVGDHSIDLYVQKLAWWGIERNRKPASKPQAASPIAKAKGSK